MPREIQAVYRSTHPQVAEFWEELQRRSEAFAAQVAAFMADYPHREPAIRRGHGGNRDLVGMFGETAPGPEWRWTATYACWTPKTNSNAGKVLKARLAEVCFRRSTPPGMPGACYEERTGILHSAGQFRDAGVLWVTWAVKPEDVETEKEFAPALWERAKLSAYYAAQEAAEGEQVAA